MAISQTKSVLRLWVDGNLLILAILFAGAEAEGLFAGAETEEFSVGAEAEGLFVGAEKLLGAEAEELAIPDQTKSVLRLWHLVNGNLLMPAVVFPGAEAEAYAEGLFAEAEAEGFFVEAEVGGLFAGGEAGGLFAGAEAEGLFAGAEVEELAIPDGSTAVRPSRHVQALK